MSPSEFDLRDALRDGEGDGLNADQIILHARARLAQRRSRLLSTVAIAAVVAGAGVGIGFISANSTDEKAGSSMNEGAGSAPTGAPHADARGALSAGSSAALAPPIAGGALSERAAGSAASVPCPTSLPQYALPGGGSPGQFGASGPLFHKAVVSVVVCAYGRLEQQTTKAAQPTPARLQLDSQSARRLVRSLETAPKTQSGTGCLNPLSPANFAIIGVTADGKRAGTVTAQLTEPACNGLVTNGTALRYRWSPPADLRTRLLALKPR